MTTQPTIYNPHPLPNYTPLTQVYCSKVFQDILPAPRSTFHNPLRCLKQPGSAVITAVQATPWPRMACVLSAVMPIAILAPARVRHPTVDHPAHTVFTASSGGGMQHDSYSLLLRFLAATTPLFGTKDFIISPHD